MKKEKVFNFKGLLMILLLGVLLIGLASCKEEETTTLDKENDALKIGYVTDNLKVNPFFIESSVERELCSYFFSQFLTINVNGEIKYGEDYNTVVKSMTSYYENENHKKSDSYEDGYYPVYEFVIKDGMKFSDGVTIALEDVLFNLYSYLDKAYTGLSTINTLPIEGLSEYQNQITKLNLETFKTIGENIKADYLAQNGKYVGSKTAYTYDEWCDYEDILNSNIYFLLRYFLNESNFEKEEQMDLSYIITNYLINRGLAANYNDIKGDNGGYVYIDGTKYELKEKNSGSYVITSIEEKYTLLDLTKLTDAEKEQYKSNKHFTLDKIDEANLYLYDGSNVTIADIDYKALKDILLKLYTSASGSINYEKFIDTEFNKYTNSTIFFNDVLNDFIEKENEGCESVNSISGISVVKIDGVDTLRIKLTKDDNTILEKLTFFVAPMHYYISGANVQYRICNYNVPWNKPAFITNLKSFSYTPVGSGPYKMIFDGTYNNGDYISLERNNYFETIKGSDATSNNIKNANIRFINIYKLEKGSEYESIKNGTVNYVKADLTTSLAQELTTAYGIALCDSLSYDSIVIDASIIPNLNERKALQSVMDVSKIYDFYATNVAKSLQYNSSNIYNIYPSTTNVTSNYDETLEKAIEYYIQAGYEFDEDSKTLVNAPSYVFYLDSAEKNNEFTSIFRNAQILLESLGISVRIDSKEKRTGTNYAVYGVRNYCALDPDLSYKFRTDSYNLLEIQNIILDLYYNGYDNELGTTMVDVLSIKTRLNQSMLINHINDLISELNSISDTSAQKAKYEEILSCYNALTIEIPVCQVYDLYIYDYSVIKEKSLSGSVSFQYSSLAEIWKVDYVG